MLSLYSLSQSKDHSMAKVRASGEETDNENSQSEHWVEVEFGFDMWYLIRFINYCFWKCTLAINKHCIKSNKCNVNILRKITLIWKRSKEANYRKNFIIEIMVHKI